MRLSELMNTKVRTLDGDTLGRVHDVRVEQGKVVALACGPAGYIERLTATEHGRQIPWECVRKISRKAIIVVPEPTKRVSASRSRRGTRRPSAPRSKR